MAKAQVSIPYTDATGTHPVGEEVNFPRSSAEERNAFETLLRYGIIIEVFDPDGTPEGTIAGQWQRPVEALPPVPVSEAVPEDPDAAEADWEVVATPFPKKDEVDVDPAAKSAGRPASKSGPKSKPAVKKP